MVDPSGAGLRTNEDEEKRAVHPRGAQAPRLSFRTEADRAEAGEKCDDEDGSRRIGDVERIKQHNAAHRRTGKVGRINLADLLRKAGQRKAHADAAQHEGDRDYRVGKDDRRNSGERPLRNKRNGHVGQKAGDRGEREKLSEPRHVFLCAFGSEILREQVNEGCANAQAEHGDGNGDEREVIPHGDAKDARQQHFEHQRRQRNEKDTGIRSLCWDQGRCWYQVGLSAWFVVDNMDRRLRSMAGSRNGVAPLS